MLWIDKQRQELDENEWRQDGAHSQKQEEEASSQEESVDTNKEKIFQNA